MLDELAETGVVFNNAYAPSPICVPGRQCIMSGQLPETCRCFSCGDDLGPGHMTFARRFGQYAYHATCAGKLHHMGADQMQGWTTRMAFDIGLMITGKPDFSSSEKRWNPNRLFVACSRDIVALIS